MLLLAAVTKFQGKLASLQKANSPNSQDNFQICCAEMYLVTFLANFVCFCEFRGISRIYLKFVAPRPREISEALIQCRKLLPPIPSNFQHDIGWAVRTETHFCPKLQERQKKLKSIHDC